MYFWSNSHLVLSIMYFCLSTGELLCISFFLPNSIRALLFLNRIFHHVDFLLLLFILWGQSILKTGGIVVFWKILLLESVCLGFSTHS